MSAIVLPRSRGVTRRDPPHRRNQRNAKLHPLIGDKLRAGVLPKSVDLSGFSPPIFDQGQSGSCTAHAISGAIVTSMRSLGRPLPFIPSPQAIYACTRAIARAAERQQGPLLPLEDTGAMLADVVAAVSTYGVLGLRGPTPDGRNSDVWTSLDTDAKPANVDREPDLIDLEESAVDLIPGEHRISETGFDATSVVAATLAAGMAVWVGFFADSAFEALKPGEIAGVPDERDPKGGGHSVYLSGLDTRSDGSLVFSLTNSWNGWCDGGRGLVGEQWIENAWDLYVLDASVAPALGESAA